MLHAREFLKTSILLLGLAAASSQAAIPAQTKVIVPKETAALLDTFCQSCHEEGTTKGDVRLDNLGSLAPDAQIDLLNRMHEQVYLKEMPPKKKTQPSEAERERLIAWISGELRLRNASKLEEKLRYPAYGNSIDHQQLFSGQIKAAPYTPARRWLVNPQIFDERVLDIFELEGKDRAMKFYGVTNPFILPDAAGIRDYDNGSLDGGTLLVMLTNADWISSKQIRPARVENREIAANQLADPKDKWSPKQTPAAFKTIILKKSAPTKEEMSAAINKQFELVLRRPPAAAELAKYLALTETAIGIGGNTEGLRQMLLTVLLESEFLYRLEFGAGPADPTGRKMLSPREGAYAISYAMGDRGPDAKLLEAAAQGRLNSKDDYKREVLRLLDDKNYYRGAIDPSLAGSHLTPQQTSHPRINRFFREFFGYPNATKIFKDPERSEGVYENPGRGTLGTPGYLVQEADQIVDLILQKDQNVFANLLTTDKYIVYHDLDNEAGRQVIADWKKIWDTLKTTNWKTEPEKVAEQYKDLLAAKPLRISADRNQKREFLRYMYYFDDFFGKGRTPFTTISTAHGYRYNHSPIYNLPPTPLRGRYGGVENPKFKGLDDTEFWDYPVEQPFKINNRKGILTHPAWLISRAQNTQTDPVTRGRWVREKLLAGRVPDVPITVDAVIPEDHQKTLGARLQQVTQKQECVKCHQYMNPLGVPFEIYDDFGRYRTAEALEHPENILKKTATGNVYKTLPVDARGLLDGTGDPALDGQVNNALEMIDRLAKSTRVRQSFIRHAFRFYMGRNEMLSDSKTLIDADNAYVKSGGSFRAVIVSLLTSDSFVYRK